MKRKGVIFSVLIILVILLTAGGGGERGRAAGDGMPEIPRRPLNLMATTAGSPSAVSAALVADIWMEHIPGLTITVEPGSMAQNMQNVNAGLADFGSVSTLVAYPGMYGLDWANGVRHTNVRGFLPQFNFHMIFVTKASRTDINSIRDLNGRVLGIGGVGGGADTTGRQLMEFFNINARLINASWTDIGIQFGDDLIDAVFYVGANPVAFLQENELTHELKFFELSDNEFTRFFEAYPYYSRGIVPAGTYRHMREPYTAIAGWNTITVRSDMDEELVYFLTKTLFENLGRLHAGHPDFTHANLDNIRYLTSPPLHPGAERYYREMGAQLPVYPAPPR